MTARSLHHRSNWTSTLSAILTGLVSKWKGIKVKCCCLMLLNRVVVVRKSIISRGVKFLLSSYLSLSKNSARIKFITRPQFHRSLTHKRPHSNWLRNCALSPYKYQQISTKIRLPMKKKVCCRRYPAWRCLNKRLVTLWRHLKFLHHLQQ